MRHLTLLSMMIIAGLFIACHDKKATEEAQGTCDDEADGTACTGGVGGLGEVCCNERCVLPDDPRCETCAATGETCLDSEICCPYGCESGPICVEDTGEPAVDCLSAVGGCRWPPGCDCGTSVVGGGGSCEGHDYVDFIAADMTCASGMELTVQTTAPMPTASVADGHIELRLTLGNSDGSLHLITAFAMDGGPFVLSIRDDLLQDVPLGAGDAFTVNPDGSQLWTLSAATLTTLGNPVNFAITYLVNDQGSPAVVVLKSREQTTLDFPCGG